jgi:retron-type reverse transcriptase
LKWLDEDAEFVRVLSFDFSKAFDSVPHDIITEKLKQTNLNPYVINLIIRFLTNRKQRVVVDGIITGYVDINKGVPQGTVIGPFLFSLMVDDIKPKQPETNVLLNLLMT